MSQNPENKDLFNDTFNIAQPTYLNACLGDNGFQNIEVYAEAYRLAPQILLDKVISEGRMTTLPDILVFPIVFCMRHAVELQLKDSIIKLSKIRKNQKVEEYNISGSHDIGSIWAFFEDQSQLTDSRFSELVPNIDPYIKDIAEIDPTGQVFRYPHDNEDKKHLLQTPIINLLLLKKRFGELETHLNAINRLSNELIEEYQQGTFTDKLSRNEISRIAKDLPDRDQWKESKEFGNLKKGIKSKYDLSNSHFSKTLNIIQEHYQFSQDIGVSIPLQYTSADDLIIFFECLDNIHPKRKNSSDSGIGHFVLNDQFFEDMKKSNKLEVECAEKCLEKITIVALADIAALYEIGRFPQQYWSESYLRNLESELSDIQSTAKRSKKELVQLIRHRLEKVNAKDSILLALNKLGQKEILNKL